MPRNLLDQPATKLGLDSLNNNQANDNGHQTPTGDNLEDRPRTRGSMLLLPGHRSSGIKPPTAVAGRTRYSARLASLANGIPSSLSSAKLESVSRKREETSPQAPQPVTKAASKDQSSTVLKQTELSTSSNINKTTTTTRRPQVSVANRLQPQSTQKFTSKPMVKPAMSTKPSQITSTPQVKLKGASMLNSRSSSVLSSVSSATTTASKRYQTPTVSSIAQSQPKTPHTMVSKTIPDTNTIRKGLAKFSNPMECQRQFQAMNLKMKSLTDLIESREREVFQLKNQLKRTIEMGVGYATTVQYFAVKLKLESDVDLVEECEQLKSKVNQLVVNESNHKTELNSISEDYKKQLKVERDLIDNLERKFEETQTAHNQHMDNINLMHQKELDDLIKKHSQIERDLTQRVEFLEKELKTKCRELADLKTEHDLLSDSYGKLEETLTKDKDARVKYAQEKISQLQKDVDSLNYVLEMKTEKIHELERNEIQLVEVTNQLAGQMDSNKALKQQLESVNAALTMKREQYEHMVAEHEKVVQDLKRERKERRRMTMRTEQLEYVLNESCCADSTLGFNNSIRDLDTTNNIV